MNNDENRKVKSDLRRIIGVSVLFIIALVGVMILSPLSSQFSASDISRGNSYDDDINTLLSSAQYKHASCFIDSLIEMKERNLPRFAYFDRFLSEDERIDAANARADIYDLQWKRIEILKTTNQIDGLRDALKDYVDVIGYNQEAAKTMLKQLNDK